MRFAGGGNEITMGAASDTATVEIVISFGVNDGPKTPSRLTGLDMRFDVGSLADGGFGPYVQDGGANPKFTAGNVASPNSVWSNAATIEGTFDRLGFFMSIGDPAGSAGFSATTVPSEFIVATFQIHKAIGGDTSTTYFVWRQEDPLPALYNGPANWGNRFGYEVEVARNQFLHGQGSPGDADPRWAYHGYEAFEPLIIHNIPEPGSIALMVLGGLAAMRRRK
jgi:hypothetical protein